MSNAHTNHQHGLVGMIRPKSTMRKRREKARARIKSQERQNAIKEAKENFLKAHA